MVDQKSTHCGFVTIIGRPNVGKSTLLNRLVGQKITITSPKPQTTRHRILGITTTGNVQTIYIDTPGMHQGKATAMNAALNKAASASLAGVDLILFVVEALKWTAEDELVLRNVRNTDIPVILVINKVDVVEDKQKLLPYMEKLHKNGIDTEIMPVSALTGEHIKPLEDAINQSMPENDFCYPEDQVTDRSIRFMAAEIIREKLTYKLAQELPYVTTVEIEKYSERENITEISAIIWVERPGQKAIVIGKQGSMIKSIGETARKDIEKMIEKKVHLNLWVKVREGWSDDERAIRSFGYQE